MPYVVQDHFGKRRGKRGIKVTVRDREQKKQLDLTVHGLTHDQLYHEIAGFLISKYGTKEVKE